MWGMKDVVVSAMRGGAMKVVAISVMRVAVS